MIHIDLLTVRPDTTGLHNLVGIIYREIYYEISEPILKSVQGWFEVRMMRMSIPI